MNRFKWLGMLVGAYCIAAALSSSAAPSVPDKANEDAVVAAKLDAYRLGAADKVRILVYNEPNLSGEFTVNSTGVLSVPLIGDVVALNRTTTEIRQEIERRLSDGYLKSPQVSIDVLAYRPFYILGEVNKPGDYPYSAGLTVLRAVATANGFTYRADEKHFFLKHPGENKETKYSVSTDLPLLPGDTIRIAERYF